VLSAYVAIWSLIKKQYGFAFIAVLLTYLSWTTLRLVAPTSLVNLCILALYFSRVSSSHLINIRSSIKKSIIAAAACISLLALYSVSQVAIVSLKSNENKLQVMELQYPIHAVDYLKQYQDGGNILNNMSSGGFLINKLSPDYKVFIDGRTNILYPIDFVEGYVTLLTDKNRLVKTIDEYGVDYVLYDNSPEKFIAIHNSKKVGLVFADENYILFSKGKENAFPMASKLMVFPSCWNDSWSQVIQHEIARSEELLADKNYSIKLMLEMIGDYLAEGDKQNFFDALQPGSMPSDAFRRAAMHLALNDSNFESAS
jgi:hypothetical protein